MKISIKNLILFGLIIGIYVGVVLIIKDNAIIIQNQKVLRENQQIIGEGQEVIGENQQEIADNQTKILKAEDTGWILKGSIMYLRENKQETILDDYIVNSSYFGIASWYDYSLEGFPDYSKNNLTCASRDYERGTYLIVRRIDIGTKVKCRVNDYGPEAWTNRIIDLSSASFKALAPLGVGLIEVIVYAEE